ncbi:M15 family metallopeptidase [Psychromonas sp. Urea-02u-13]|uniref:M15 family metallopeptidase n=1 Tax=Psychromonas sp. Urea-02u-13 TaxID=2058326 RepID=UPI000C33DBE4|nr:M15 family metallopeptidase [Psychromonas sp. Urea-02u-13]PKG39699.1 peptidase M15 [Psychromonas sp. Urea-02u-13]
MNKKQIDKAVSGFALSSRSNTKMLGVENDLKKVTRRALELSAFDFAITSGHRTEAEQHDLYLKGHSQLDGVNRKSKHQHAKAIDFMAYDESGKPTWDMHYYREISEAFKQASRELNIPIVWGGDWNSFKDGPHVELA